MNISTMRFKTMRYDELQLKSALFTNPRQRTGLSEAEIVELALDMGRNGLNNPLRVTPAGTITAGQRRHRALGYLLEWRDKLGAHVSESEHAIFDMRAALFRAEVPVVIDEETDPGRLVGRALADNLNRAEMSSYDIAETIVQMVERCGSQRQVADEIGRDKSYVSRMVSSWKQAVPELHVIWASGQISFEEVYEMTRKPAEEQSRILMTGGQPRGPHGRPGIDSLKRLLETVRKRYAADWATASRGDKSYRVGVIDALRIAAGEVPISDLEALLELE
jgi:hypothetical protein